MRLRDEVFAAFIVRVEVFWVVTPSSTIINYRRFEETYRLHLQEFRSSLRRYDVPKRR
jgi:hypothetical protein